MKKNTTRACEKSIKFYYLCKQKHFAPIGQRLKYNVFV